MRRSLTPKKNNSRQQQRMKNIPISQMISSLLTATSTQYFPIQNNMWRFSTSKSQVVKFNDFNATNRPQTSRVNSQQKKNKQQIIDKQKSNDRKSLRPKSSIKQQGLALYRIGSTHQSQQQININSFQLSKTQGVRNYHSMPKQGQIKVQYKLVNNDNLFQKVQNKPPKSIKSTKPIGLVRGYGVNSHKFTINAQISQGRILIIANLTKTTKIQAITSLYAIFQSNKSVAFLQFVRQHFQIEISKKLQGFPLPTINKQLIQACLHRVQNKFCQLYNVPFKKNQAITFSITNSFGLSYSMVFVRHQQIIVCTKGKSQVVNSLNLGAKLQGQHSNNNIFIRKIAKQDINSLDFIALISEGMTTYYKDIHSLNNNNYSTNSNNNNKQNDHSSSWIQRQLWHIFLQSILNKNNQNIFQIKPKLTIHEMMGNSIDSFFTILSNNPNLNKNMSIVLIAFKNLENMLGIDQILELPYVKQCVQDISIGTQVQRVMFKQQ